MPNLTLEEFNAPCLSIEKKAKALLRSKGEHALTMLIGNGSDVYLSCVPDGSTGGTYTLH